MQDYLAQAEQHAGWGFGHFDQLIDEGPRVGADLLIRIGTSRSDNILNASVIPRLSRSGLAGTALQARKNRSAAHCRSRR